ncbi:MAG: type II toxin-antitoxin system VapC family toxin [Rhizobiaceae bacterium]|nr:type II toxin-antitoxin system VapC family toxin [Rhizobiaceae bacterium]
MILLLDAHILIWLSSQSERLSPKARDMLSDPENRYLFSTVRLWELAIKKGLDQASFHVDPRVLRRGLLANYFEELPVLGNHALAVEDLPLLNKDPFDRLLIAQARTEGALLVTADAKMAEYGSPVRFV